MKKKSIDTHYGINPFLGFLAMFVTQDIVIKIFFREIKIQKEKEEKMEKIREGVIDPETERDIKDNRPRRQMAINARDKVRELYEKDLV